MAVEGYVSSKVILARLYRELGLTNEISESEAIELIADALEMIGSYSQYTEMNEILELEDGKVRLPENFYKLVNIRYQDNPMSWSTNSLVNDYYCEDCVIPECCTEYNLYINNSFIITNIKAESPNNEICISYLGIPVDEDGYPMIPADIYFYKACVSYITSILDYREWRKGNIPKDVMMKSEQNWLFYVNSARGSANLPNLAQLENLKNLMTRLIPSVNQYHRGFRDNSKQERRRRFN
jgi:hypothetical protein